MWIGVVLTLLAVQAGVSSDRPTSGRARFLEALEVRKNAIRGFGFGLVATVAIYVLFVGLAYDVTALVSIWYAGLALSLALALGALATTVLVALQARKLAREV